MTVAVRVYLCGNVAVAVCGCVTVAVRARLYACVAVAVCVGLWLYVVACV